MNKQKTVNQAVNLTGDHLDIVDNWRAGLASTHGLKVSRHAAILAIIQKFGTDQAKAAEGYGSPAWQGTPEAK